MCGDAVQLVQFDQLRHPCCRQIAAGDVATRIDPLAHDLGIYAEQLGQQPVHVLLELAEVAGPFGGFGQADVFLALPPHGMK